MKRNIAIVMNMRVSILAMSCFLLSLFFTTVNAQSQLLKDINQDEDLINNEYSELAPATGILYFIVDHHELWKTTGSPGGTVRLKDYRTLSELTPIGNSVFFIANDDVAGQELWKSNGRGSGTMIVKDINPGPAGTALLSLTNVNGLLYFVASDNKSGYELWKSDGTDAGTVMVKDIFPKGGSSNPSYLTAANGILYFSANDGVHGYELWKSDGTTEGTVLVKDIKTETKKSSQPQMITAVNGGVFFTASNTETGRELYRSDGTETGTVLVKDIRTGANSAGIDNLANVNGILFFSASDGITGQELWKSDGTAAGTTLVRDMTPGPAGSHGENVFEYRIANFTAIDDVLYFTAYQGRDYYTWKSDGTENGTIPLQLSEGVGINHPQPFFTELHGKIYYFNVQGAAYEQQYYLWRMDKDGTHQAEVKQFDISDDYYAEHTTQMVKFNNVLYLSGRLSGGGYELIKCNGTTAGTVVLKDAYISTMSSNPSQLTRAGNMIFFVAEEVLFEQSLWRTDGTPAGTIKLQDVDYVYDMEAVDNFIFYSLGGGHLSLWKTDGTPEGTELVKEDPAAHAAIDLININGTLFFHDYDGQLWKSDGTGPGTVRLKDFNDITSMAGIGPVLLFIVQTENSGEELWKSNGTVAGTLKLASFQRGQYGTGLAGTHAIMDHVLYFIANDGVHGNEVWRTDGTAAGTYIFADLNTSDDGSNENDIRALAVLDDTLYISALDYNGWGLYKSAASGSPLKVSDMNPVRTMVPVDEKLLLFSQRALNTTDVNLWVTDGSAEGTEMINDGNLPGSISYVAINGMLYYSSYNTPLWKSDGTSCGTFPVTLGVSGSYPIAGLGDLIVFNGISPSSGAEPYVYDTRLSEESPCATARLLADSEEVESDDREMLNSYPNPFTQDFALRINGREGKKAEVRVFTSFGMPLETYHEFSAGADYRVGQSWPPGMYLIRVIYDGKISTHTVIKR